MRNEKETLIQDQENQQQQAVGDDQGDWSKIIIKSKLIIINNNSN